MLNNLSKIDAVETPNGPNQDRTCKNQRSTRPKNAYAVLCSAGPFPVTESNIDKIIENGDVMQKVTEIGLETFEGHKNQDDNGLYHSPKQSSHRLHRNKLPQMSSQKPLTVSEPSSITPKSKLMVVLVVITLFAIFILSIVIPVALTTRNKQITADSQTTQTVPLSNTICSVIPSVRNSSLNYQVERLDFNCTQSFSKLTIKQIVQRDDNETHAQQYQTFWKDTTNMTYVQTPSEIIYTWFSLPGKIISETSFPHFIEAQYYYTSGSMRVTSHDTWFASLTSISGHQITFFGTF